MNRVRDRIGDKRVLGRVKAFLRAGILSEEGFNRETQTSSAVCRYPPGELHLAVFPAVR